jgi:RNA polymerase-binding protein DksA
MGGPLKNDDAALFRSTLMHLRSRLRGDLDQMTDEAFQRTLPEGSGNLSNLPIHLADVGTENYDHEFTLGLIENEQAILGQIDEALGRIDKGSFGLCAECQEPIARPRLQALPYTPHCIECARKLERPQP